MGLIGWLSRATGFQKRQPIPLHPDTATQAESLAEALARIIEVLDAHSETHWRSWMNESLMQINAQDFRGVQHLLNAYGGMGSFNDLIIGQGMVDGNFEWAPNAGSDNDRLDALRSQAYGLAKAIHDAHHGQTG